MKQMTGPITIQIRPGSAGTQAEVNHQFTSAGTPDVQEIVRGGTPALRLGMKKWVIFVKEPFPAREVARTLRL